MTIQITQKTGFLFYFNRLWIDAEHEHCRHLMNECPDYPVANKQTLDLYAQLLTRSINAEARLDLLRQAILADNEYDRKSKN